MASVTQAAGVSGLSSGPSGPLNTETPAEPSLPRIQRIGPVRILREGAGWDGVSLRLRAGSEEMFELALTAGDGRCITVATIHHDDAVAAWRAFGQASGLPLLIETSDGVVSQPYPQLGRLALGPIRIRRRYGFMKDRRPRFLTRRKPGAMSPRPRIHAGERLTD